MSGRGFSVRSIEADPEFHVMDRLVPNLPFDYVVQDKHIPTIERYIWTVKNDMRSRYITLPFTQLPKIMVIHLASNAVFWLNVLPHVNGLSSHISPQYILTGQSINFNCHMRMEYREYVQMHESHDNTMSP